MKSISIFHVDRFDVTDSISFLEDAGSLSPVGKTLVINHETLQEYTCTYNVTINEDILVKQLTTGQYVPADEYKKSNTFPLFYNKTNNIIFILAPTTIVKGFVETLTDNYGTKVGNLSRFEFDFGKISKFETNAKGLYFNVDDTSVDTKHFFGAGVQNDDEANEAIDNKTATYLMAQLDVAGKARTIGFSRKGALVIYSKPDVNEHEKPYLQLAMDTLLVINQ
ncbi:hypothetical protein [Lactiplantibacillus plantarum]|uniref:hypothetical protein n=1 Tax=Lactiplantibacillus plantarum TaxID=1590 RepID=UPI001B81F519|nr:hypothetical protein [Lactiplantibacillus plantarum]GIQ94183.1 hypothetical protein COY2906_10530 [Lactiplantibacillus plantarum]